MQYNRNRQLIRVDVENKFMGTGNSLNEEHEYMWEQGDLKSFASRRQQKTVEHRNYVYTLLSAYPQFTIPSPNGSLYPLQQSGYLGLLPKHLPYSEDVLSAGLNQSTTYEYSIEEGVVRQCSVYLSPEVAISSVTYEWEE